MTNVLIVASSPNFFSSRLRENIDRHEDFNATFVLSKMESLSKINEQQDIIVVYAEQDVVYNRSELVFIRDYLAKESAIVFFAAGEETFSDLEKIFEPNITVGGVFKRPLNVSDITKKVWDCAFTKLVSDNKKRVLVVDDSGPMLRSVRTWLEPRYNVSMANSGINAIKNIALHRPDLILLDYEMPVCDGPRVLEMIRKDPDSSNIPVIFLTSKDDRDSVMAAMKYSPNGYLLKTLPQDKIIEAVDKFFEEGHL